ncbi:CPBP family intramembrane glutamic endopeptidase [Aquimarina brevivitae]|uniref:CAAX prenyl protease 2/Lysostaphin resistance protein A-like domain-containing protein n=1 Tax=Aquimarina brevivitae TaxID=323412 RepID=A0A4Q7P1Z7_9FLAO|nr:CPBP family intramembrane glutamic endopeptidase [Aquimarina brevivitae]RZS93891.1 hypothetical protein EV197_2472 [Aquimarina brevivitae]
MIGIAVLLVLSHVLLKFILKKNLMVLGWTPIGRQLFTFLCGTVLALVIHFLTVYLSELLGLQTFTYNDNYACSMLFRSLFYHLQSAFTEELVFRGALLFIVMNRFGIRKALFISAFFFGIYHWFSYNIWDKHLIAYVYVFIATGFMGYVYGYSYAKSGTILLPLGLHLGWNYLATLCCDAVPYGELLFESARAVTYDEKVETWYSLLKAIMPPLLMLLTLRILYAKQWLILKHMKGTTINQTKV